MYNVGFGDCFLLIFPKSDEHPIRKVLIDCGSIKKSKGHSTDDVVARLIADITAESDSGQPHLDVVVATHRHADHISGFGSPLWRAVRVGEVWMPWTEADEPGALALRARQERLAQALTTAFAARPDPLFSMLAADAKTNVKAVETLKQGFAGSPELRYLEAATSGPRDLDAPTLRGVSVYLLGPTRDEAAMRAMDPAPDESFLALWMDEPGAPLGQIPTPFGAMWRCVRPKLRLDSRTERAVQKVNDTLGGELALRLDGAINNTSLMLVFAVGNAVLLFPGDAQWGSWKLVLNDPAARRLLERVTFLKVGHHGSHNSTPQSFVHKCLAPRKALDEIAAMISVVPRGTWDIPRQPLVDALKEVTDDRIVRSDDATAKAPFTKQGAMVIEAQVKC